MGLASVWRFSPTFKNHIKFDLISLLLYITTVKAEIRCYCNQPSCVPTGYMCKSMSGACFTELFTHGNDLSKSRHGCAELLSVPKRDRCISPTTVVSHLPVIFCCKDDMCNYMNAVDFNIQIHTKSNRSQLSGTYDLKEGHRAYENALQQDLWFKAAVIAVPIAGGFILILLILLATRMLRQDSKRQRQLLEFRRQQTLGNKSQILFGQPCLNHPNCNFEILAQGSKSNQGQGNTNFSLTRDSWCADVTFSDTERQYVCDKENRNSVCASLLPWTKWNPPKSSTCV